MASGGTADPNYCLSEEVQTDWSWEDCQQGSRRKIRPKERLHLTRRATNSERGKADQRTLFSREFGCKAEGSLGKAFIAKMVTQVAH